MSYGLSRRHSQYGVTEELRAITESRVDPIADLAYDVLMHGLAVDSRYGLCVEKLGGRIVVDAGTLVARDGINYSLGWMETIQLLAGVFDPEALKRVAPKADHELFTYKMAYGPRIVHSVQNVIDALRIHPNTRQAVLFIAHPNDGPTSDLPCTTSIQFLLRGQSLSAIVSMRSWDLCRGLPYDLMMFTGILNAVALCLGVIPHQVIVTAGSAHIYRGWEDRLPSTAQMGWRFTPEVPRNWHDLSNWALFQIPLLEKGGVPEGIEYVFPDERM